MIQLTTPTKHKLADLGVLSQKNRKPDENPGAQLQLEALLPLDVARLMFPGFVEICYEDGPGKQGSIEGMETPQLTAVGQSLGWTSWKKTHSGHTLTIDFGMGGASNPVISGCTLSRMRVKAEEGAVLAKYMAESEDISEALFGKLAKLKSCEVMLTIDPPSPSAQRDIDDDADLAANRKAGAAERAAAGTTPSTPHKEGKAELSGESGWPFPTGDKGTKGAPPAHLTEPKVTKVSRTARGQAKTKAALAAGAAAAAKLQ